MTTTIAKPANFDALRFCIPESSRYGLGAPWTLPDGTLAASDLRILIVFPESWHDGPKDLEGCKPKISDILSPLSGITEWHEFPEIPNCSECGDTGKIPTAKCQRCAGIGSVECNLGHDHDCDECEGTGKLHEVDCESCRETAVGFGDRDLALHYARLAKSLPGSQWQIASLNVSTPIYLRFEGGHGCVMPLTPKVNCNG